MVLFSGIGPPFVNPGVCPSGQHLDSHWEGIIVTVVSVYPARRRTSPRGIVPVGLGDGVGDCHDVVNFLDKCLFISLSFVFL